MWPGKQPPEGGQEPQQQPSNPYLQPGYHQPSPFQQPQASNAPPPQAGMPVPRPPSGGRSRSTIVAAIAATAVVAAAIATGFVLLGSGENDRAGTDPTKATSPPASPDNSRDMDTVAATVKGWQVVVNPSQGIAFDVPPQWARQSTDWVTYVSENDDPEDTPLIGMRAPAYLKEQWCSSDEDKDGTVEHTPLAVAGSRGNNGARSSEEIAGSDPETWVYGQFTQPDKTKVRPGEVEPFTTNSGIKGSLGAAWSVDVKKTQKCSTDGKAWTFAFKNTQGDLTSWSFFGAKGVSDEVPEATVRKIAATVRLYKVSSGS
ncbi:hypothetical protein G3I77_22870 [Streptomyces sp. D2-8]|uniref:hypothetical protein n=1 Tax=Streptomyces sp. D2-8 TaxID=2707767 RepID=UPI0020C14B2B|nr:hypothetical protein [Streptomyces sp. D2-8]MCK8435752.1 hypothetical protein [Streptomyces sp. D2-8]